MLHRVLRRLLCERVSIKCLDKILEAIGESFDEQRNSNSVDYIVAAVRQRLGRIICEPYRNTKGDLQAITIDEDLQKLITNASLSDLERDDERNSIAKVLQECFEEIGSSNMGTCVLFVEGSLRPKVSHALRSTGLRIPVLSRSEVPGDINVVIQHTLELDDLDAEAAQRLGEPESINKELAEMSLPSQPR